MLVLLGARDRNRREYVMKRLLLTSTAVLAIGAVVPATAQTTAKKNVQGGKCWVQTDARRLTG